MQTAARTWRVYPIAPNTLAAIGKPSDIPELVTAVKHAHDADKLSKGLSSLVILKTKGFPLSVFRTAFHEYHPELSINEIFPFICKYEDGRGDVVKYTGDKEKHPLESIIP